MTEPFSSRKRPLEHISEEEEKSTPKKKVVARDLHNPAYLFML